MARATSSTLHRAVCGVALSAATLVAPLAPAGAEQRASAGSVPQTDRCPDADGLAFLCGVANAEDIVYLREAGRILAGGLGPRNGVGAPGALRLIDPKSRHWRQAYPTGPSSSADAVNQPRGASDFPGCKEPPDPATMAIHGLALRRPQRGGVMVYAINHAADERIEVFTLVASREGPTLQWVGCVLPPKPLQPNSLAVTRDGTIITTVLRYSGEDLETVRKGQVTGGIYEWTPGQGVFAKLPLQLSGPNGIEISPDGRTLYFAEFGRKRIIAWSRADLSRPIGIAQFEDFWPDNVHWDDRGRLITAGMNHNYDDCIDTAWPASGAKPACARAYRVEAVDPISFRHTLIAEGLTHPPFSNVSAGLVVGDQLWLGAYNADRIAVRRLPHAAKAPRRATATP